MVSKGFPNVVTSGQQYDIGEKPVILYTYINRHAGTPKLQSRNTVNLGIQRILTKSSRLLQLYGLTKDKVNLN